MSVVGDGAVTARRLLGSGLRLARDAWLRRSDAVLPRALANVDRAWLSSVLGGGVERVTRLDRHSGTTTREILALEGSGVPERVFVKIAPDGWGQRLFVHALGLGEREVRFYREIAADVPVRVPRIHHARANADATRFALVLEDVSAAGARFVAVGEHAGLDQARAVMAALATLHAAFWESPRFAADLGWVPSRENRGQRFAMERFLSAVGVRSAARQYGNGMPAAFAEAVRLVCERRDALEEHWGDGPRTLVHGDCHIGNLFFEGEGVGFFDWQVIGRAPGLRDVSYFLAHSLPTEVAARHEEELLRSYRAGLEARGVSAPSEASLWQQHRAFALYGWLAAAFTAGAGGLQPERIARAGLERATATLERLGSTELFRAL